MALSILRNSLFTICFSVELMFKLLLAVTNKSGDNLSLFPKKRIKMLVLHTW